MDTSKKYIEMCERAEVIQHFRRYNNHERNGERNKVESGDFYYAKGNHSGDYETGPDIDKGDIYIEGDSCGGISMDYPNTRVRPDGSRYSYDDCAFTWLPRQDQLQDMLTETHMLSAKISMFHDFYEPEFSCPETDTCKKCQELGIQRRTAFDTMEQLWLAFVMKEKYQKEWNDKDWVKYQVTQ